jgi:hypothetical protein
MSIDETHTSGEICYGVGQVLLDSGRCEFLLASSPQGLDVAAQRFAQIG